MITNSSPFDPAGGAALSREMDKRLRLRWSWGTRDAHDLAFHRRYYRWWTCQVFWTNALGVKIGPLTMSCWCRLRTRQFAVDVVCLNFYGVGLWYL